jgi:hypothetical protein
MPNLEAIRLSLGNKSEHNFRIVEAEFDSDAYIFSVIRNEANLVNNKSVINNEKVSEIGIISGDSDYIAMFPFKKDCLVMDLIEYNENEINKFNFSVLNFKHLLFTTNSKLIMTYYDKHFLCFDPSDFIVNTSTWIIGATSPNDYISASFWSFEIYKKSILNFKRYKKIKSNVYKSILEQSKILPFLYFENYLQEFSAKKELYSNSIRFLSFSDSNIYYLYDLVTTKPITDYDIIFEKLNILFANILHFNADLIKEKELSFKINDIQKETFHIKSLLNFFI